jgi:DNA-binding NarL/FixJ family response regulator
VPCVVANAHNSSLLFRFAPSLPRKFGTFLVPKFAIRDTSSLFRNKHTHSSIAVSYTLLIVDDHPLVREGLAALVGSLPGGVTVHQAGSAAEALALAEIHAPLDAVLLDCGLPDADGAGLVHALKMRGGATPVVVISANDSQDIIDRVMQAGAVAFVSKSKPASAILLALKHALQHGPDTPLPDANPTPPSAQTPATSLSLTARQLDILLMLDQGHTNHAIALQLGLSEKTVKNHATALFRVLNADNRLQAVRQARELRLIA